MSNLRDINQAGNNPKKVWNLANRFTGASSSSSTPPLTAGDMNTFFLEKVKEIRASITPTSIEDNTSGNNIGDTNNHNPPRFTFAYPSASKVLNVIRSLKNTAALGTDGISVAALKLGAPALAAPIAHLARISFTTGIVPDGFKTSILRPVYKGKGKPRTAASSYRPVAILPAMSKILERLVMERLSKHLEDLLPETQCGFQAARNTTKAITFAHGAWTKA